MRIKSVEFAGAIGQIGQAPPESAVGALQVAFAGRSNVGKSSLINRLLGRTRTAIARVSAEPGKTQEINFYNVRSDLGDFFLVDLPGYGYARVPQGLREKWGPLIQGFLANNQDLRGVVQLVDVRNGPTEDDVRSVDFLAELEVPVLFVLTKVDKLNSREREKLIPKAIQTLGVDADQVILFSAPKGTGRDELLETLGALLFPEAEAGGEPGDEVEDVEDADE
jgi:GTP-binding protein